MAIVEEVERTFSPSGVHKLGAVLPGKFRWRREVCAASSNQWRRADIGRDVGLGPHLKSLLRWYFFHVQHQADHGLFDKLLSDIDRETSCTSVVAASESAQCPTYRNYLCHSKSVKAVLTSRSKKNPLPIPN